MSRYAESTSVSVERSLGEIQSTLQRYGARGFAYGWKETKAMIDFEMEDRRVRFVLDMPDRDSPQFKLTPSRKWRRSDEDALKAYEQACRQRYRALSLVIKAKLEAVEAGITEFEDEFMAHIVLPNGSTVRDHVRPAIAQSYETGKLLPLLPGLEK